jgi:hypothetical protein
MPDPLGAVVLATVVPFATVFVVLGPEVVMERLARP